MHGMSDVSRAIVAACLVSVAMPPAAAVAQGPAGPRAQAVQPAAAQNILEQAASMGLGTFAAALEASGLQESLGNDRQLTIFAPTDAAFASLPKGTLETLLLPENKPKLRAILAHHVVPGSLLSMEVANIEEPQMARTAAGDRETIGADRRGMRFGTAKVVQANIRWSNGVIHVIDRVVLPEQQQSENAMGVAMKEAAPASLLEALRAVPDGRFSSFVAAVEASGADQDWALGSPDGNWTLFIPTNAAFARLSEAERTALLDPKNRDMLRAVLDWHALPRHQVWSFVLNRGERAPVMISENNDRFVLDVLANGAVFVYRMRRQSDYSLEEPFKARIVAGDIPVGGTVVHVVDRVLVPPQFENSLIASQAYPEKEVKEFARGEDARFMASYVLRDMLQQAESMEPAAAVALYEFGLRMLEEVVPVERGGMMIMGNEMARDRKTLRTRLESRVDDLDRVWYAKFIQNSPTAKSLAAPLPDSVARQGAPAPSPVVMPQASTPAPDANVSRPTAPPANGAVRPAPTLDWCEVLEKAVDPKVVTDAALAEAIASTGLPWRVRDRATGIEMLLVPSGEFRMGKIADDAQALANEVPAHSVTITQPYYLGRYEVTREQWAKQAGTKARTSSESVEPGVQGALVEVGGGAIVSVSGGVELVDSKGNRVATKQTAKVGSDGTVVLTTTAVDPGANAAPDTRPGLPVLVAWNSADEFCRAAGLRLPTEAEWEYACRAGVQASRYGDLDAIAWHLGNSGGRKHPIGTKDANPLGFHDMLGNAWEWVGDWYGDYTRSAKTDPSGPESGESRIARGSFFNYEEGFCRATRRYKIMTPEFAGSVGLRVARNP